MARSKKNKLRHDSIVRKLAKEYKDKGYKVEADIKGSGRPDTIWGLRPDLRVQKSGHETVIEIETQDSVDSKRDKRQQRAFKNWSENSTSRHYKRIVTE